MLDAERFLREVPPFRGLPPSILTELVEKLKVKVYPKNEIIYRGNEPAEHLFLVRKGYVVLEKEGNIIDQLQEGETFGYLPLITGQRLDHSARAVEDTVVFLFKKEDFLDLFQKYPVVQTFYTQKLAQKLAEALEQKKDQWGAFSSVPLAKLTIKPPIIIDGQDSVEKVIKELVEKNVTACLVKLEKGYGIITERDLLKKILYQGLDKKETKAKDIASHPLVCLEKEAPLSKAMLIMAQHRIRKIVVVDEGLPIGILEDTDIISLGSKNLITITKEIERTNSLEDLKKLYYHSFYSAIDFAIKEKDPELIGRYLAEIRDGIIKRGIDLTLEQIKYPEKPKIMVIGAHGRREASFRTTLKIFLIKNHPKDDLFEIGLLLAKNLKFLGIEIEEQYLTQPYWLKTLEEWKETYFRWIVYPDLKDIGKKANFFDLRLLNLSTEEENLFHQQILQKIQKSDRILPYLALDAVKLRPPLGFFKEFLVEKTGPFKGKINLFKSGVLPLVCVVRVLSLEQGIKNVNTFKRISQLEATGSIKSETAKDLKEAYRFLTTLRFKTQVENFKKHQEIHDYLDPAALEKGDLNLLKEVFKFIENLQKMLFEKYRLSYLS
ncbi:cyclic nucleotide-binding domain-containing protein [Thermodesulfobacterium sp. TA1]|uniref:putative nucleotidyltransferase substrate binding domain-containing protein n=1 Tax=Thermodesulfobacterium sp. TA1 TaxID=2234087 RepID=UPI001232DD42|nr:putative nucleotidyltransferase substrate binding domain-containing protein [Thermodesulfobacterium sp. TA1]QER42596.1 cyclic nucleotide-binding domain-containing protein [Thermodesulfobacterium sp. TA1]